MSMQVYGHWSGIGSFARVSSAIAWSLRRRGLHGTLYAVNDPTPRYECRALPVGFNHRAAVGIFVGYPEGSEGWLEEHQHRVLVTVCETDPVPQGWVSACNAATLVVVPSEWCKEVYETSGVKTPIIVAPHGVSRFIDPTLVPTHLGGPVHLLHVSGALSFPWRKGTSQLLLAFRRIHKDFPNVILFLRMKATSGLTKVISDLGLADRVCVEASNPDGEILYESYHAVIQPSRGEGFGMVGLEARCLGVPVVLTDATGHAQHFATGVDVPVQVDDIGPMSTQGNDVGVAPVVTVAAVEASLRLLLTDLPRYQERTIEWAKKHAQLWSWPRVLAPLVTEVAKMVRSRRSLRLGEEAGL